MKVINFFTTFLSKTWDCNEISISSQPLFLLPLSPGENLASFLFECAGTFVRTMLVRRSLPAKLADDRRVRRSADRHEPSTGGGKEHRFCGALFNEINPLRDL